MILEKIPMKTSRFSDAQIMAILKQAEDGISVAELCREHGMSDLAPKFYPVLSSLQRFLVAVVGSVAAGCGAEPFRLRSTASRRGLSV